VKFSEKICWGLQHDEVPEVIDDVLKAVKKFLPVPGNIFINH